MAKYWSGRNPDEEEEEEEALSLCDLPTNLSKTEETQLIRRETVDGGGGGEEEGSCNKGDEEEEQDFDFGWWGNKAPCSLSGSHMCAADELFFEGRILPRRLSISSDNGPVRRSMSRSESMDHGSASGLGGSRSSSIGSYRSYTSSSSSSSTYSSSATTHDSRTFRTHGFHMHPSPKPARSMNASSGYRRSNLHSSPNNGGSSLWDFFRTGLVRGPAADIEFRDLKHHGLNNNKRNSVTGISSNDSGDSNAKSNSDSKRTGQVGWLFGGVNCKCSVDTVPLNAPSTKMGPVPAGNATVPRSRMGGADEKPGRDSRTKEKMVMMMKQKQAMSRQRTSEWLKELSLSRASKKFHV